MKKENYGIPAVLISVAAYALAYYTNVFGLLALTIAVFALAFNGKVRKVVVQALSLALIFLAVRETIDLIVGAFDLKTYAQLLDDAPGLYSIMDKVMTVIARIINYTEFGIVAILIIAAIIKQDIIISAVHKAVDGFVPVRQPQMPYGQPQQFAGQSQQFNGQPQQFNGQPQQFNGQPQQFNGQPQRLSGQPQQFSSQPQQFSGQPQQFSGQPQQFSAQPQQVNNQPQQYSGQPSPYNNTNNN